MWIPLVLAGPPDVTQAHDTGARALHDAAVVFGIEDYANLADVSFARRDYEAWRTLLLRTRGVPNEHMFGSEGKVVAETLLAEVQYAAESVESGGTLWIVYSGHGYAGSDGERLLLPSEASVEDPRRGAVRLPDLLRVAEASKAARILVVLDACFSGLDRAGRPLTGSKDVVPLEVPPLEERVTVWAATEAGGVALPWSTARQGRFTWFAVGALRGWADGALGAQESDGRVTYAEAQEFVRRGLSEAGAASRPTRDVRPGWSSLELSRGSEDAPPASTWEGIASGGYRTVYEKDFREGPRLGPEWIGVDQGYFGPSPAGLVAGAGGPFQPTLLASEALGQGFRLRWTLAVRTSASSTHKSSGVWVEVGGISAGLRVDGKAWLSGPAAEGRGRPTEAPTEPLTPLLGGIAYVLELRREGGVCELLVNDVPRQRQACGVAGEGAVVSFHLSDGQGGPGVVLQDVVVSVPSPG